MPFQPDHMSPDTLRRLVKQQRRAMANVLNQDIPQHQAQEIVAQTLGYATWHEALSRVGQPADLSSKSKEVPRRMLTPIPPVRLNEAHLFPIDQLITGPSLDRFRYHWSEFKPLSLADAPVVMIQGVLSWLVADPARWTWMGKEDRAQLIQRVRQAPKGLAENRDAFLERAWSKPDLFMDAVELIPVDQLWPWLHRAARARRRDVMDAIHGAHERAIGSEPFHALNNAVYAGDQPYVERLIEKQCQRYQLDTADIGGTQRGRTRARRRPS